MLHQPAAPKKVSSVQPTGRKSDANGKAGKGLRHFSLKVCRKVEEKGHTSYNEVADELVKEFLALDAEQALNGTNVGANGKPHKYDEKNIRRRVYDALNVLMAMDILYKEKKEIYWKGLPCNGETSLQMLEKQKEDLEKETLRLEQEIQDQLVQQIAFVRLVERNKAKAKLEKKTGQTSTLDDETKIALPFIVLSADDDTTIECDLSEKKDQVHFTFSKAYKADDDAEVLKKLNLHKATFAEIQKIIKNPDMFSMLPDSIFTDHNEITTDNTIKMETKH